MDEDGMRALMQLQYNANKLHIEFHQKVVALRSKYEANLEAIYQALNQTTNNSNIANAAPRSQKSKNGTTPTPTKKESFQSHKVETEHEPPPKNKNTNNVAVSPLPKNQLRMFRPESEMSSLSQTNAGNKSVPAFWYRVFANSRTMLREIQIVDQPILYCLKNVKVKTDMSNLQQQKNYSFMLEFHFDSNDYFTNSVLTKEYFVQLNPSSSSKKANYSGPQVVRCRGCQIYWKPGMNVTEIEVRSLKNDKNKKNKKVVVKHYTKESFFNFFSTPEYSEREVLTSKQREELEVDYALGCHIKEKIVPRAISYFLGEVSDSSSSESSSASSSSSESSLE